MIVHIALFKWKIGIPDDVIEMAMNDVRALKTTHKDIIDIRCGKNFSKWNEGFTHAVIVTAKTHAALDAYRKHPKHTDVADRIDKMEEKSIGFDFED